MALPASVARVVRTRASFCCEYCWLPAQASAIPFEIDHIIARKHGGPSDLENLALSCFYCNSAKGPNIAGIDSETGLIVPLYHPRQHRWQEHFVIDIDLQSNGKIIVLSQVRAKDQNSTASFSLMRFMPNGEIDMTFGERGISRL